MTNSTVSVWVEYVQQNLTNAQHVGLALQGKSETSPLYNLGKESI